VGIISRKILRTPESRQPQRGDGVGDLDDPHRGKGLEPARKSPAFLVVEQLPGQAGQLGRADEAQSEPETLVMVGSDMRAVAQGEADLAGEQGR
jgi:hypothetical protein